MIKVNSKIEAWDLAGRLFPSDYLKDGKESKSAGHPIFRSTKPDEEAWISDLGDRLELNYPNGSSENIWIEEPGEKKPGVTAYVGQYEDKIVFGHVTVPEISELQLVNVVGLVVDSDTIEITSERDGAHSYDTDEVEYIRFE